MKCLISFQLQLPQSLWRQSGPTQLEKHKPWWPIYPSHYQCHLKIILELWRQTFRFYRCLNRSSYVLWSSWVQTFTNQMDKQDAWHSETRTPKCIKRSNYTTDLWQSRCGRGLFGRLAGAQNHEARKLLRSIAYQQTPCQPDVSSALFCLSSNAVGARSTNKCLHCNLCPKNSVPRNTMLADVDNGEAPLKGTR